MYARILIVATFFGLLCVSRAQDCYMYHSCSDCTAQQYCGWCDVAQSCWQGNESGPINPFQSCPAAAWNFGQCNPIRLREGTAFTQNHITVGTYDYYVYTPEDNSEIQINIDTVGSTLTQYIYASQNVKFPKKNRNTWKTETSKNLYLNQTSGAPVYIGVYEMNAFPYQITVYQPPA